MAKEIDHSFRKHALLSASGASRWIACTPSSRLEEEFIEEDSEFALEGTLAHEFAEISLLLFTKNITKKEYDKKYAALAKSKYYSREMDGEVEKYTDFVLEQYSKALAANTAAILLIEQKVDLSKWIEEGFGSNDAIVIHEPILEVNDLKYGKGVEVSAVDNDQLKLYALGAYDEYSFIYTIETVRLNIVQPRLNKTSTWEISVKDLLKWAEDVVVPAAKKAFAGEGEQVPGEHCRWCKVKPVCRALAERNLELAKLDFSDPSKLSDSEIIEIYSKLDVLRDWANSVDNHVLKEAKTGKKWEGYKLVRGKANRKWKDEKAVAEILEGELLKPEEYLNTKIKGLGDIETLVGKKRFPILLGKQLFKPLGSPKLVKESEPGKEIGSLADAKEDFK